MSKVILGTNTSELMLVLSDDSGKALDNFTTKLEQTVNSIKESKMNKWDAFKPLDDGSSADIQAGVERIREQVKVDLSHMSTRAFSPKGRNEITITREQLKEAIRFAHMCGADEHAGYEIRTVENVYDLILKRLHI